MIFSLNMVDYAVSVIIVSMNVPSHGFLFFLSLEINFSLSSRLLEPELSSKHSEADKQRIPKQN